MKSHHSEHVEAEGFMCPHCGQGPFKTRDELRKHIFENHMSGRLAPSTIDAQSVSAAMQVQYG
jgi:hypothetical protein